MPPELGIAHDRVTKQCLLEKGFAVPFSLSSGPYSQASLVGFNGLFGSEEAARATGYSTTENVGSAPIDEYQAALPEAQQQAFTDALFGREDSPQTTVALPSGLQFSRSSEGCFADADRAVYGSIESALTVENFVNLVNEQSSMVVDEGTDLLDRSMGAYESCMADAGYQVDGLTAEKTAAALFGEHRRPGEPPSEQEQQMAATDFQCQRQSSFSEDLNALFIQKSSSWIVENEGSIITARDLVDESLMNSRTIIRGS